MKTFLITALINKGEEQHSFKGTINFNDKIFIIKENGSGEPDDKEKYSEEMDKVFGEYKPGQQFRIEVKVTAL